jgi:thioredoxin-related protein
VNINYTINYAEAKMKKVLYKFFVLVIILSNSLLAQENVNKSSAPKFDPQRDPFKDLKEAIVESQSTDKRIILDVGGEWCIWCRTLDAFLQDHSELYNYLHENFVVLKINYSKENKNEKFLSQYSKVAGYPHFFVLEKDGKLLYSENTSELEKDKSYDAEKIMTFLKEWSLPKGKS